MMIRPSPQEYLATLLYSSQSAASSEALQIVLLAFNHTAKSLGGLQRELVDTGIRCALRCGDHNAALLLARSTQSLVRLRTKWLLLD